MKLRGWVIPTFLLVGGALLLAWFMQGPARTAQAIQHALDTSNTVALTQHIDFPQLRTRVKDRVVRAAVAQTPAEGTAAETLAVITGPAVISPVVDRALTPEALVAGAHVGSQVSTSVRKALQGRPAVRFEGHDRAKVILDHPNGDLVLIMERNGMKWRVVDATMEGLSWEDVVS